MLDALLDRFRHRDRLALSRLLTLLARGEHVTDILTALGPVPPHTRVVAVTGSGGVGKSTLVGKLIETARGHGQSVAVLACDPQSPLSGGALLGDRFRMPSRPDDSGVFIRSLATAGGHGAVAEHLEALVQLLAVFGFDLVLIETVGAGQGDTAVRDLADVVVLLLQPETGDDLQWEKAGLLEVADIVVIHKADLPGAEYLEGQVRAILGLTPGRSVPVLRVSARSGAGVEALWTALTNSPRRSRTENSAGRDLLRVAQETLTRRFQTALAAEDGWLPRLVTAWQQGQMTTDQAVVTLSQLLADRSQEGPE